MIDLRDYQTESLNKLRAGLAAGKKRQILTLPTGAGKTVVAAALTELAVSKGNRVMFFADRQTLVDQTVARFAEHGIEAHTVMQTDICDQSPVQVASVQTCKTRGFPKAGSVQLAIVDECHGRHEALEKWLIDTGTASIGLSATPFAAGLMSVWQDVVTCVTTKRLIDDGWLMQPRVFSGTSPDLRGVPVVGGEYQMDAVAERMAAKELDGRIVEEWQEKTEQVFGGPAPTLVFAPTIAYGRMLCQRFANAGYDFRHVFAGDKGRELHVQDFAAGHCDGLVSVDALAKGFDQPKASVLVAARPVRKSYMTHIQMLGRVMRPAPGKETCIILDHAGNYGRHQQITHAFWTEGWSADFEENVPDGEPPLKECPVDSGGCGEWVPLGSLVCPVCGYEFPPPKRNPWEENDNGLTEKKITLAHKGEVLAKYRRAPRYQVFRWVQGWQDSRPYRSAKAETAARAAYKDLTGSWPRPYDAPWEPEPCPADLAAVLEGQLRKWKKNRSAD